MTALDPRRGIRLAVRDYDLATTLASGQAFRWQHRPASSCRLRPDGDSWEGVIGSRWVRLTPRAGSIDAETSEPVENWDWLREYLQTGVDLDAVLQSFPDDPPLRASVAACRGLRLLRQDPWECLASFLLSSTKQIVQIQEIVALLCVRFGAPIPAPAACGPVFAFPTAGCLARATEAALRACKMGFRAPNLLAAARAVDTGVLDLAQLRVWPLAQAREQLVRLPGVGPKIANCVLLFAGGFAGAFPVDVWVMKALRELYFPRRQPRPERLQRFVETYFGPNAGYAQQYLFHYIRTRREPAAAARPDVAARPPPAHPGARP